MSWLSNYSQKKKKTKRAVIEEALKDYQEKIRKEDLQETFKRAAKDSEIIGMAEEGMDDYEEQLNALGV
ncbi:MAG: CopG family transcriptional regulator [Nitrospirae bacterium]|nr:CopG family transcriptional regulator [Nitrospirota bacterium]